jgi:hypothetical protein
MRSLIVVILFLIIFESCGTKTVEPLSIEGKLVTRINTACGQSSSGCIIRLKDVTNFAWDRVFVFKHNARQSEIEKVIGAPYPQYEEFKRSMIFLNGGTVVYSEVEPTDIERPINNQVEFDIAYREVYRSYSSESQFEVKRKHYQGNTYHYELKLIESPPLTLRVENPHDFQSGVDGG